MENVAFAPKELENMENGAFAPKEQVLHFPYYFQKHISKASKGIIME